MNAAANLDSCTNSPGAAAPTPLPRSNAAVQPDRGDWEFLMCSVGRMHVRPLEVPHSTLASAMAAASPPARPSN